MRLFLCLLFFFTLIFTACDKSKEFTKSLDRVSGYINTGLLLVERQTAAGQMDNETGIAIVTALQSINELNGQAIEETKKYLSADGTKLELTSEGKINLSRLIESGRIIAQSLINNPHLLKLPLNKREHITLLIRDLADSITTLSELIATIKEAKK